MKSKFNEKRGVHSFDPREVKSALAILSSVCVSQYPDDYALEKIGATVNAGELYTWAASVRYVNGRLVTPADLSDEARAMVTGPIRVDCLDACIRFLVKYGFLVDTSKTRWVVRKPFTPADVEEACEVVKLVGAPKYDNETVFDTLRRMRRDRPPHHDGITIEGAANK